MTTTRHFGTRIPAGPQAAGTTGIRAAASNWVALLVDDDIYIAAILVAQVQAANGRLAAAPFGDDLSARRFDQHAIEDGRDDAIRGGLRPSGGAGDHALVGKRLQAARQH